ncbi:MFS transporter [Lactobacillus delbrueckii]|nr:MFS transporter [Lactobacillus delbrueckii]MDA3796333.1 MFS transporter [Lactobacillus delbrueckii]
MVIAKFVGSKIDLLLDGLTFIISGLLIRQLDILFETEPPVAKQSNFSKIKDAFKYLLAEKNILIVIVFASVINFILAGYELILPFASFAFSKNAYAFFLTAESVGGLLGAVASNLIQKELSSKYLFWIIAVAGLPLAVMSSLYQVSHWLFGPIICITLFNFCISVFNIQFMTYIQTNADMTYIGRVFSIVFTAAIIFVPLGSFFFQFVMDVKDSVDYLWLGGLLTFVAGLASVIYSLNQRRAE